MSPARMRISVVIYLLYVCIDYIFLRNGFGNKAIRVLDKSNSAASEYE